jgi:hypothetical protein
MSTVIERPTDEWGILAQRGITPPTALEECDRRIGLLQGEVVLIQGQLAAARPDGTLPDDEYREYLRWKKRAAWALQCKVGELGALRRWRHANIAPKDRGLQPSPERKLNDRRHLARCAHTLGRVREHLDDEGLLILNAAEAHLREG